MITQHKTPADFDNWVFRKKVDCLRLAYESGVPEDQIVEDLRFADKLSDSAFGRDFLNRAAVPRP